MQAPGRINVRITEGSEKELKEFVAGEKDLEFAEGYSQGPTSYVLGVPPDSEFRWVAIFLTLPFVVSSSSVRQISPR